MSSRRFVNTTFGRLGAIVVSIAFLTGASEGTSPTPVTGQLVVASYGGSFAKAQRTALFDPFQAASGVEVIDVPDSSAAKAKAIVDSGNIEWDVVSSDSSAYPQQLADGILEPLDYSVIDTSGIPGMDFTEFGVGYIRFALNMMWSTDAFPNEQPATWADFFDVEKFPGKRALGDTPFYNLEIALLADGVAPSDLYPLDVERALRSLDRIKAVTLFKPATDREALLDQGEVVMITQGNGRAELAIQQGGKYKYSWDQALVDVEYWTVLKGARNRDNAMRFIAFAVKPEQQAKLAEAIPYGPTNERSYQFVDAAIAKTLPTFPDIASKTVLYDGGWWFKNRAAVDARWRTWLLE